MGLRSALAKSVEKKLSRRLGIIENRISRLEEGARVGGIESGNTDRNVYGDSSSLVVSRNDISMHRETLVGTLGNSGLCLEFGPYFTPIVKGENARYFDVFDTEELKRRASLDPNPSITAGTVPDIHYSDPDGDLSSIEDRFSEVVSSHCIEHQPDLVNHLECVFDLLEPGGRYVVFVPDKRYCFDHYSPLSSLGDVLQADHEKRKRHTLNSLLDMSLHTHNDADRHWAGDHFDEGYAGLSLDRARTMIGQYAASGGEYIDCHAWKFTPHSFAFICTMLHDLGKVRLSLEAVGDTRVGQFEFSAIFVKN